MKKLLTILSAAVIVSSSATAVVACSDNSKKTITYGVVDNGQDNLSEAKYKEMEELYYQVYGKEYTLKGVKEVGDNEAPNKVLEAGAQAGPDVYGASVDLTARLAKANAIMALDGPDAPEGENGAGYIIDNMNYTVEHSQEVFDKFNIDDTENDQVSDIEEWTTWLPSAVEVSKVVNTNEQSQSEGKAYQYGITRGLGVGGGSAITRIDDKDNLERAGWVESSIHGTAANPVSFDDLIDGSSGKNSTITDPSAEGYYAKNSNMAIMLDRGMWEMYPIYSNVISDPIDGKVYKASEIGVNWVQDKDSPYYNDKEGKYSSIFTNPYFATSMKEVLGQWFDLWSQTMKVAINNAPANADANHNPMNLLDPTGGINSTVKKNYLDVETISSTTAEPTSYADFTIGAGSKEGKGFANLDFINLNSLSLFDETSDKELYDKYEAQGVNNWLTPAGSNQTVFSINLAGNPGKIDAAVKWVELLYGFVEQPDGTTVPYSVSEDGKVVPYTGTEEINVDNIGGMYNLNDMFAQGGTIPSKIAIENPKWQEDEEFNATLAKKIDAKVAKAIDKDPGYKSIYNANKTAEDAAIVRLEKYSLDLAAGLYGGENELTVAPQVTAYDPATFDDWHGQQAMKPALTKAYFSNGKKRTDFDSIYGAQDAVINFEAAEYISVKNTFISEFLTSMNTLNLKMNQN